jgi:hypothetical protein
LNWIRPSRPRRTARVPTSWRGWQCLSFHLLQEVTGTNKGRTNRLLSLMWHGPHLKWRVQQFFYCCVCICYRGNVSTEPLPSNDRGIFTKPLPSNDRGDTQTHSNMIS